MTKLHKAIFMLAWTSCYILGTIKPDQINQCILFSIFLVGMYLLRRDA
jgi:hypothetical protein